MRNFEIEFPNLKRAYQILSEYNRLEQEGLVNIRQRLMRRMGDEKMNLFIQ